MKNAFLYLLTVIIWGSTWIAITYQLGEVAVTVSLFYRFFLASLLLLSFCLLRKKSLRFSLKQHAQLALFGLLLFGMNYYFLYLAEQHINSALTAIAFSSLMVMNIINARIWYKTQITQQVYLGALLGSIGIVVLFWPQVLDVELGEQTLFGLGLCLAGTVFASNGNMLAMRNQKQGIGVMQANAWGMLYGSLFMAVIAIVNGERFVIPMQADYVISLLYLSIFGSVIAFGCYLTLMQTIGAHKTSYASIMFPAVAVVISTFVEGFVWNGYTFSGFALILMGNLIVLLKPKAKPVAVQQGQNKSSIANAS